MDILSNHEPIITYGDMQRARRWLIVDDGKMPASGWTHPRLRTADGRRAIRIASSDRRGGVMCTAATPESWLTFDEAQAIIAAASPERLPLFPAYVHIEGASEQFFDADYHPHPGGNAAADFADWRDRIFDALRDMRGGAMAIIPSKSGAGAHAIFRLPQADLSKHYPKVVLPCACGKDACEHGGKIENWIGKGNRYRIQVAPFADALLEQPIPLLSHAEIAAIPELADEYNRKPPANELPDAPEYAKSLTGAGGRILLYLADHKLPACALEHPERGFYFADAHSGEWTEFGDIDSPLSLNLHRAANDYALSEIAPAVTPEVAKDFAAYLTRETQSHNLPEIKRQIIAELARPDVADAYGFNRATRRDFNRRAGRYLRTRRGFVDLRDGGKAISAAQVTAARLTADAPALLTQSEDGYTPEERSEARRLTDALVLDAWGIDRFKALLWHSQYRKGCLFIVGGRNRGKGLLADMLQLVGFAAIFPWSYAGCPRKGGRPPAFDALTYARATRRLVVIDELTGARGESDCVMQDDEVMPDNARIKEMHGDPMVVVERKHKDPVHMTLTGGLTFIANAPPCIPAMSDVYALTDTNFIDAPARVDALAEGGFGYAPEVLSTPPALNHLIELVLAYLPEVARLARAPIVGEMVNVQARIADACQQTYDEWRSRKKGKRNDG